MKGNIHKLFDCLLETTAAEAPECFIGFSLSHTARLGDFLPGTAYDHPYHLRLGVGVGSETRLEHGVSRLPTLLPFWKA